MVFNSLSLIKRYTPPTCILEIYQKKSLFSWTNSNDDFYPINFQLHFDDPRSLHEDKFIMAGDRNLLRNLREKINNYLLNYVGNKKTDFSEDNQLLLALDFTVKNPEIFIEEKGLCCHQLSYGAENKQIVNLTNTQLFDLANALENYHLESKLLWQHQKDNQRKNLLLLTAIVSFIGLLGGFWWWRNQQMAFNTTAVDDSAELSNDSVQSNVDDVIPPSPLDANTIPPIITPTETEAMKNRATLPPPPATLTQPPINPSSSIENNGQTISLNPSQDNNILPPPQAPSLPPAPPPPQFPDENIITIPASPLPTNSQSSLPQPPSTPTVSTPKIDSPPKLSGLPVLQSLNSQPINNNDSQKNNEIKPNSTNIDLNPVAINQAPDLSNLQSRQNQSVKSQQLPTNYTNPLTQQVQKYFEEKWQPPENLNQSIEYRLLVAENGSLNRVTPLGQAAKIFLDRTGMPLLGETIASSSATESVMIRLILSPNGDVKTFEEF